ncbi:protein translocase subunit SecD [Nitrosomonadales bacterium]|jgi:preprotein translocase subunit SecD|nr:protein translocase subunit SecD [Nitrosomonadales bacterium]
MNQSPRWKYLLILTTILLSVIFVMPNFYGESPAIQIMPIKTGEKIDTSLLESIDKILEKSEIQNTGLILENYHIKVKLKTAEDQLKAKSLIQKALGNQYVVALNLISNSPNWLSNMGALPMYLGLDLRGGVHFLMQVDLSTALEKTTANYLSEFRTALRKEKVGYYGATKENDIIQLKFKSKAELNKGKNIIRGINNNFDFKEIFVNKEIILKVIISAQTKKSITEFAIKQNLETLNNRVNELGVAEPVIQQQGLDRIVIQLPGVQDTAKAKEILGRTATLEMRMVNEDNFNPDIFEEGNEDQIPLNSEILPDRFGNNILVKKEVILTGQRITDAGPGVDQNGQSIVSITLDSKGASVFKQVTRENVGKRMALLLIEKNLTEIVTAPVIKAEIGGGRVQITGMANPQEATDVALLLRAGSLAAPMEIIEERTVGPSMGKENISRGVQSTLWGFIAIIMMMAIYYMVFGVISVITLSVNLFFLVALLSSLQATLTLPGLAAIALTLGMAIDSSVLINERIRDEIRNGNTPQASISMGYKMAWGTILDSNITTMIAGLALFMFGSGPIKGFAVVLVLGILTSMFSAIFVSRAIVNYIYGNKRQRSKLSIGEIFKVDNN